MNIVNITNMLDFDEMRYKKQYNDSPQVLVSRQTSNSIERDNFSATYLTNSYIWNYKAFRKSKKKKNGMQLTKKHIIFTSIYGFFQNNFFRVFFHKLYEISKK